MNADVTHGGVTVTSCSCSAVGELTVGFRSVCTTNTGAASVFFGSGFLKTFALGRCAVFIRLCVCLHIYPFSLTVTLNHLDNVNWGVFTLLNREYIKLLWT